MDNKISVLNELESGLIKALEENPSAGVPYHNNKHMLGVWKIARNIWRLEGNVTNTTVTMQGGLMALCIASLLHDYNHSAGKQPDDINISNAKMAVRPIIKGLNLDIPACVIETAIAAIECTQFPFVTAPRNRIEEILRDADLLYATMSDDTDIIMKDLRKEVGISKKQMMESQRKFSSTAVLYTTQGKYLWFTHMPSYLDKMERKLNEIN